MAWNCLYQVTPEQSRELNEKAHQRLLAFCKRHDIPVNDSMPLDMQIEDYVNHMWGFEHKKPLEYWLYKRVLARAYGHPKAEGVAYGYVGYSTKG